MTPATRQPKNAATKSSPGGKSKSAVSPRESDRERTAAMRRERAARSAYVQVIVGPSASPDSRNRKAIRSAHSRVRQAKSVTTSSNVKEREGGATTGH